MAILMHVLAGGLALGAGYVALATTKGSSLHRRSGMLFVYTMLVMAGSGTAIAAIQGVAPAINVPAGMLTAYLVITALTTVRPPSGTIRRVDRVAMLVALAGGLTSVVLGIARLAGGGGRGARAAGVIMVIFGGIGLLAGLADRRRSRSAPLVGAARLRRHLWRMCTALLIASMAFYLGQADEFPQWLRIPALLALPVLGVLVAMLYWLWRVRRGRAVPAVAARPAPSWATRRRLDLDEDDFRDEIRAHLALAEAERIAEGADREAAHYAALKDFGNVTLTTEAARRVWTPGWLEAAARPDERRPLRGPVAPAAQGVRG